MFYNNSLKKTIPTLSFHAVNKVILVNEADQEIGHMEKLQAHREGRLHRAFSIFLFNDKDELLLQKRAESKYHSGGLWTNTCCSHPAPNETLNAATVRRLKEELNLSDVKMEPVFSFIYKAIFDNGLTEHELDHVFIGRHNTLPDIIAEEASAYRFISEQDLQKELAEQPDSFSYWFKIAWPLLIKKNFKCNA